MEDKQQKDLEITEILNDKGDLSDELQERISDFISKLSESQRSREQ